MAKYNILLRDLNTNLPKPTKIKEDYLLILASFGILPLIKILLDLHQIHISITYC